MHRSIELISEMSLWHTLNGDCPERIACPTSTHYSQCIMSFNSQTSCAETFRHLLFIQYYKDILSFCCPTKESLTRGPRRGITDVSDPLGGMRAYECWARSLSTPDWVSVNQGVRWLAVQPGRMVAEGMRTETSGRNRVFLSARV